MGKVGLTDKQEADYIAYGKRARGEGKVLTEKQKVTYNDLCEKRAHPKLPDTCTSYLKEWYSHQRWGAPEDVQTKYTLKGIIREDEAIEAIAVKFGEPMEKNEVYYENDYMTGTPDVVSDIIYDTKCPWNGKTFLAHVTEPNDTLYEWQMRGYMYLVDRQQAKVCYVLLDTPEEINQGNEVKFSDTPIEDRIYYFTVDRDYGKEREIEARVELCKDWLYEYDKKVCSELNK